MTIQNELYPLSTQNSQAIPLDVILPIWHLTKALTFSFATITLPARTPSDLLEIYSDVDAYLDFAPGAYAVPVDGTAYDDLLFIPKGFVVSCVLPAGDVRVRGVTEAGRIQIQGTQKWAALALPRQITQKLAGG